MELFFWLFMSTSNTFTNNAEHLWQSIFSSPERPRFNGYFQPDFVWHPFLACFWLSSFISCLTGSNDSAQFVDPGTTGLANDHGGNGIGTWKLSYLPLLPSIGTCNS